MLKQNEIKVGFIGFGNMAQAIADGFLYKETLRADQIYACGGSYEKLCRNTEARGIFPCRSAEEVAEKSAVIFIAVKPNMVEPVTAPICEKLQGKILISVAAGMLCEDYDKILPGTHHLSTIPNTPVSTGEGIFITEDTHTLTDEEFAFVKKLLETISLVKPVAPSQFSIAGTIAGCGPALTALFVEALGDAGVLHGLSRDLAYQLASQMIVGTGKMLVSSGMHPGALKDGVCSPGGTTIVGVTTLERKGLRSAVIDAVDAIETL